MTTRQRNLMSYLRRYLSEHDRLPTTREIGAYLGVWQNAAVHALKGLAEAGLIERDGCKWRFKR